MEQQAGKGQEMQPRHSLRQPLVVARQAAEARHPGEGALHHPAPGQEHEAALGLGQLDHLQPDAVLRRRRGRLLPGVALVDEASSTRSPVTACTALASAATCARSCSLAGVTRSASRWPRVSMAMCIFGPCAACARRSPLARRSPASIARSGIEDDRARRRCDPRAPQQHAQIVRHRLEAAGGQPAARLLIDRGHGGKSGGIMRQCAPVRTI